MHATKQAAEKQTDEIKGKVYDHHHISRMQARPYIPKYADHSKVAENEQATLRVIGSKTGKSWKKEDFRGRHPMVQVVFRFTGISFVGLYLVRVEGCDFV